MPVTSLTVFKPHIQIHNGITLVLSKFHAQYNMTAKHIHIYTCIHTQRNYNTDSTILVHKNIHVYTMQ